MADILDVRVAPNGVAEAQALYRAHVVNDQSSDDFLEGRSVEATIETED